MNGMEMVFCSLYKGKIFVTVFGNRNYITHRSSSEASWVHPSNIYLIYRLGSIKIISSVLTIMTDTL